ncbi:unnamed protein product [Cyprideis torosa]|uniref:Uncharacterized protein n=1 Tax=Cyprideis torosa TaxID=163714 RepID=A0A7R8WVZ5_9CRUS|nr:unnamed protein product [Cyprideis torosa]CAG0911312.1 unnamed protein product [Cyprideis torosa]
MGHLSPLDGVGPLDLGLDRLEKKLEAGAVKEIILATNPTVEGEPRKEVQVTDCIFCRIVAGEIPAEVVYETDTVLVFKDLNPQAPIHLLAIPKKHIATINDMTPDDAPVMGQLFDAARQIAKAEGFDDEGYRTVMNCGIDAGQSVFHVHLHIMAGRALSWPPG